MKSGINRFKLWVSALAICFMLAAVPSPAISENEQPTDATGNVLQQGASSQSYGIGQLLGTLDVDLPGCWERMYEWDCWAPCPKWDKCTITDKELWKTTFKTYEFTLPSDGWIFLEVDIKSDNKNYWALDYLLQKYDEGEKWSNLTPFVYKTPVEQKYWDALTIEKDGNLKTDGGWKPAINPAGQYRIYVSQHVNWHSTFSGQEFVLPGKGTFKVIFVPNAKPVSVDSDGDGVPNDKDQCPNTPSGTAVDENGCPRKSSESTQPVLKVATLSSSKSIEMKNGLEFKFSEPGAISFPDGQMIVSPNGGTQITVTDFIKTDQDFSYESRIDPNGEPFNILVPKDPEWKNWQSFEFVAIPPLRDSAIYKKDEMDIFNLIAKGEYMPQQGYQCVLVPAGPPKPLEPVVLHGLTRIQYLSNFAGPKIYREFQETGRYVFDNPYSVVKIPVGLAIRYYFGPWAKMAYDVTTKGYEELQKCMNDAKPSSSHKRSGINTVICPAPNENLIINSGGYLLTLEKDAYFVLVQEGLVKRINDSTGQSLDIPGGYAALFCPGTETIPVKIDDLHGAPLTSCEDFYAAVKGEIKNGSFTGTGTRLIAESRTATPNSTIQVPIRLNNAGNIGSMNFVLTYNPLVLRVNKVDSGSLLTGALFTPNYQSPPEVRCGVATSGGVSGSGTMAYIEFQVIGAAGSSSPLTFSELSTGDASGQPITVNSQNGTITVATSKLKGDYNGDGKLSEVDALAALRMSVKLLAQDLTLDMNGDGKLTAEDARLIIKKALGK